MRDEGNYFIINQLASAKMIPLEFRQRILPYYSPQDFKQLEVLYPFEPSGLLAHNLSLVLGDYFFECPANKLAETYSSHKIPVYRTRFSQKIDFTQHLPILKDIGVVHGTDIPFSWLMDGALRGAEKNLSRVMVDAMMNFASCKGTCTVGGYLNSTKWPQYNTGSLDLSLPIESMPIGQGIFELIQIV